MTERKWLTYADWADLFAAQDYVRSRASGRKWQLLVAACCREAFRHCPDKRGLRGVEAIEELADGSTTDRRFGTVAVEIEEMIYQASLQAEASETDYYAELGACPCCGDPISNAESARGDALNPDGDADFGFQLLERRYTAERVAAAGAAICRILEGICPVQDVDEQFGHLPLTYQKLMLHEVFGNPFRRVILRPSWLAWNDRCVERVAQRIYDERRFADLPILADALEDAGCDNADILNHCRSGGEHVRGCWVVDLLLGKK